MKLQGEKRRERKLPAKEVVHRLETEPSRLNEQLGITPEVKAKLLGFLDPGEFERWSSEDTPSEQVYLDKLATAESLLILFPEERRRILEAIDLEKLRFMSTTHRKKMDFWSFVLEFDPTYVEKLEIDEGALERRFDVYRQKIQEGKIDSISAEFLEETIRLFLVLQKLNPKKYSTLPLDLKSSFVEWIEGSIGVGDFIEQVILIYLKTMPENHVRVKQQLKDQHISVPKVEDAVTDELGRKMQIQLLAASKIILAEEIKILPSGEIRAVEYGQLGKTSPLPERSAV